MIRFENISTYYAENVVVKDIIDTSKFDISSIFLTSYSHPVSTRILYKNQLEFIFENIQLPFEDAANDGYVAFKIKTKPNLVIGDEVKNKAEIFFDFNVPIVTNDTKTIVTPLVRTEESDRQDLHVTIHPNPVSKSFTLQSEANIQRFELYDVLGKNLMVSNLVSDNINVNGLLNGVYFIKVYCEEGVVVKQLVKQ